MEWVNSGISEGAITQTKTHLRSCQRSLCTIFISFFFAPAMTFPQTGVPSHPNAPYKIDVSVDEVRVIFHASDASGKPIGDLKLSELDLFDNENGPGKIVALQKLQERPLRIGFLLDTSGSISTQLAGNRMIAIAAARRLMRTQSDYGLAIGFRRSRNITQSWSKDLNAVEAGIERTGSSEENSLDGTSLFDSLFSTCLYEFGTHGDDQNVILLFSDGVDTSSFTTLQHAIDMCQHVHTAIYALTSTPAAEGASTGPATLRKLTEQTGGRVIPTDTSEAVLESALEKLDSDLRNEYELFYRPKHLQHDGSFHRLVLAGPARAARIDSQSGYFAPCQ